MTQLSTLLLKLMGFATLTVIFLFITVKRLKCYMNKCDFIKGAALEASCWTPKGTNLHTQKKKKNLDT